MVKTIFVKSGFCPAEISLIDSLIEESVERSRSDVMRMATMIFVNKNVEPMRVGPISSDNQSNGDGMAEKVFQESNMRR